jgi:hypothetical protein
LQLWLRFGGKVPYWWLNLDSRKETPSVLASAGLREGRASWKNGSRAGERRVELGGLENVGGLRKGWRKREGRWVADWWGRLRPASHA